MRYHLIVLLSLCLNLPTILMAQGTDKVEVSEAIVEDQTKDLHEFLFLPKELQVAVFSFIHPRLYLSFLCAHSSFAPIFEDTSDLWQIIHHYFKIPLNPLQGLSPRPLDQSRLYGLTVKSQLYAENAFSFALEAKVRSVYDKTTSLTFQRRARDAMDRAAALNHPSAIIARYHQPLWFRSDDPLHYGYTENKEEKETILLRFLAQKNYSLALEFMNFIDAPNLIRMTLETILEDGSRHQQLQALQSKIWRIMPAQHHPSVTTFVPQNNIEPVVGRVRTGQQTSLVTAYEIDVEGHERHAIIETLSQAGLLPALKFLGLLRGIHGYEQDQNAAINFLEEEIRRGNLQALSLKAQLLRGNDDVIRLYELTSDSAKIYADQLDQLCLEKEEPLTLRSKICGLLTHFGRDDAEMTDHEISLIKNLRKKLLKQRDAITIQSMAYGVNSDKDPDALKNWLVKHIQKNHLSYPSHQIFEE